MYIGTRIMRCGLINAPTLEITLATVKLELGRVVGAEKKYSDAIMASVDRASVWIIDS